MSTSKPNIEPFLSVLKKSGLVDSDRLQKAVASFVATGGKTEESNKLADHLISNGTVTKWQAEKLLQGKHKGYFLGKYRLLSLLGKGGMSSVYLAEHTLMRRRCALKVLPTKRVNDSSYLARFHREAQAVASLDHPNIVRAYDVDHQADRENEIHFLVMEYVEGYSLQELVQKNGVCDFVDAAEYIRQSAQGLQHAHEAGMVHRDVKPGNLLVDPNGVVKVLDLGLARFFTGNEREDSLTVAHDEKVLGTADYLAPEQALDSHTVDARADIYALGCTLYLLLTGRPPFTEGTLAQRLMAHQTKTPPTIESLRPDVPASLAAIVRKMMEKKPEDRYSTAKELADVLFHWIDDNSTDSWRMAHSNVFGTSRKKEPEVARAVLPVAKPIVAQPVVAMPVATAMPFDFTQPSPAKSVPESSKSTAPIKVAVAPAPAAQPVEPELSNFFASLSGEQAPVESASAPVTGPGSSLSFLKQPPHLTSKSSLNIKPVEKPVVGTPVAKPVEPVFAEPIAPTGFPDFGGSATTPEIPIAQPVEVETPAPTPPAASKSASLSAVTNPKNVPMIAGLAGGGLSLLVVIAFFMGWLGGTTGSSKNTTPAKWTADKRETTVGGGKAEFRTIVDALKAVRSNFVSSGENDQFVIHIAAGTYRENISIDATKPKVIRKSKKPGEAPFVPWPSGIKLQAKGEVVLEPGKDSPKDGPVVRLRNIERFVMEGIDLDASGRPTAVEISGDVRDTQLVRMTIRGFTENGISCRGAQGFAFANQNISDELVFDQLQIEGTADAAEAVGIRLREDEGRNASYITIKGCRFSGPMSAGVSLAGSFPFMMTIAENTFHQVQNGVLFEGSNPWRDIVVANNTFHEAKHGVLFATMPEDSSSDFVFRRNLFSKIEVAEAFVQKGFNEAKFTGMFSKEPPGAEHNWSDRPAPAKPLPGEVSQFFTLNGKRGEKGIEFGSTDPTEEAFLAPTDKAGQRKVELGPDAKNRLSFERPWIGAIGPKP